MSEESKKFKFDFKLDSIDSWRKLASDYITHSSEIMKSYSLGDFNLSESVMFELQKMNVNSIIFRDYLDDLKKVVEVKDDKLTLSDQDIANVWKCLLSVSESKKYLLDASISLEIH